MTRKTKFVAEVATRYLYRLGVCFLGATAFVYATTYFAKQILLPWMGVAQ